jgi:hypothetical protein
MANTTVARHVLPVSEQFQPKAKGTRVVDKKCRVIANYHRQALHSQSSRTCLWNLVSQFQDRLKTSIDSKTRVKGRYNAADASMP